MTVTLQPASSFGLDELASLFTAAYEDYFLPFRVDEATYRLMIGAFDLDLDGSRVAVRDGEPVALANLGVRATETWVGGIGVVPHARRAGIAERLMRELLDVSRERGVLQMRLEVLEQNAPASRLYEKLGFEHVREVEVWSLPAAEGGAAAEEIPVDAAQARIRDSRRAPEPWQRADETLAYYRTLDPPPQALGMDGGVAVFRRTAAGVALMQIAAGTDSARALFEAMRSLGDVSVLNLPVDDPAAGALRSLDARVAARQNELALRL